MSDELDNLISAFLYKINETSEKYQFGTGLPSSDEARAELKQIVFEFIDFLKTIKE